jgi:hypothetical protein
MWLEKTGENDISCTELMQVQLLVCNGYGGRRRRRRIMVNQL